MMADDTVSVRKLWLVIGLLLPVTGIASYLAWRANPDIANENHVLENQQVVLLLLASMTHFDRGRALPSAAVTEFHFRFFSAVLLIACAIREVDIDTLGQGNGWAVLEQVIRIGVGLPFLAYMLYLARRVSLFWQNRMRLLDWPVFQLSFLGGLVYLLGWPFDKELFAGLSFAQSQFAEEVVELLATVILLAAACPTSRMSK